MLSYTARTYLFLLENKSSEDDSYTSSYHTKVHVKHKFVEHEHLIIDGRIIGCKKYVVFTRNDKLIILWLCSPDKNVNKKRLNIIVISDEHFHPVLYIRLKKFIPVNRRAELIRAIAKQDKKVLQKFFEQLGVEEVKRLEHNNTTSDEPDKHEQMRSTLKSQAEQSKLQQRLTSEFNRITKVLASLQIIGNVSDILGTTPVDFIKHLIELTSEQDKSSRFTKSVLAELKFISPSSLIQQANKIRIKSEFLRKLTSNRISRRALDILKRYFGSARTLVRANKGLLETLVKLDCYYKQNREHSNNLSRLTIYINQDISDRKAINIVKQESCLYSLLQLVKLYLEVYDRRIVKSLKEISVEPVKSKINNIKNRDSSVQDIVQYGNILRNNFLIFECSRQSEQVYTITLAFLILLENTIKSPEKRKAIIDTLASKYRFERRKMLNSIHGFDYINLVEFLSITSQLESQLSKKELERLTREQLLYDFGLLGKLADLDKLFY